MQVGSFVSFRRSGRPYTGEVVSVLSLAVCVRVCLGSALAGQCVVVPFRHVIRAHSGCPCVGVKGDGFLLCGK